MKSVLSTFALSPVGVPPPPTAGEVHVWRVPLDPPTEVVARLRRQLSPDEVARADRFHFERHRRRFTVGRATLRHLLGGYMGRRPEAIRFAYGKRDKPRLAGPPDAPPVGHGGLEFNLSNSYELALVAVAVGSEVGIDLEAVRPLEDVLTLSERYFSARELAALLSYPDAERDRAFYRCWTRKEAYVKAVGDGIAARLDRFDVSLEPGGAARILALAGDPARAAEWTLIHIEPGPGYVGALALPGRPKTVRGWQWSP